MIGEGARKKWLQERARAMGLTNVIFLPYQPLENLGESLSAADLHLIPLAPGAAGCLVPSKIYGILAAGRPFIAMMEDDAEVAQIARDDAVGFVVRPGDVDALIGAIRRGRRCAGASQADGCAGAPPGGAAVRSNQSHQQVRLDAGRRHDVEF